MSYSVIGRGLLDEVPKSLDGVNKVLIVHPQPLAATAELLRETLVANGFEALLAEVPQSEEAKRRQAEGIEAVPGQVGVAALSKYTFLIRQRYKSFYFGSLKFNSVLN